MTQRLGFIALFVQCLVCYFVVMIIKTNCMIWMFFPVKFLVFFAVISPKNISVESGEDLLRLRWLRWFVFNFTLISRSAYITLAFTTRVFIFVRYQKFGVLVAQRVIQVTVIIFKARIQVPFCPEISKQFFVFAVTIFFLHLRFAGNFTSSLWVYYLFFNSRCRDFLLFIVSIAVVFTTAFFQ